MTKDARQSTKIKSEITNGILEVSFEDRGSRNAFSLDAAREFKQVLETHEGRYQALVMSGRGRVFCSGGNLSDYASMNEASAGISVNREISSVLDEIDRLKVPTVVAVSGDCFGGGVELVSAFDFVFAAPHVFFGLWQRRIGLTFGWGGGARLERRLGPHALRRLAISTEELTAEDAFVSGLVDGIYPSGMLENHAREHARKLTAWPQEPVAGFKEFRAANEAEIFESLWWKPAHLKVLTKHRARKS